MHKRNVMTKGQLGMLEEIGSIVLLVMSVFAGVWYSFYIKEKDLQTFKVLYTWLSQGYNNINIIGIGYMVLKYIKKLLLIWLCGWIGLTSPLGWMLTFSIIFSYSFTTTAIVLLFGGSGVLVALFSYGLQAVLCVSVSMMILKRSVALVWNEEGQVKKMYMKTLVPILGASLVMALLDLIIMNNLQAVIK